MGYLKIINPTDFDAFIFFNDKKPWWKKRRPRLFVRANSSILFSFQNLQMFDLENLWIRFGKKRKLYPLKNFSKYLP